MYVYQKYLCRRYTSMCIRNICVEDIQVCVSEIFDKEKNTFEKKRF